MDLQFDNFEDGPNPLDNVEDVLNANNWVFHRTHDDEIIVQISGKNCDYRLFFIWQEDISALQFCCQYDLTINAQQHNAGIKTISALNEKLWMGHFDLPQKTLKPSFRQTCLFRGISRSNSIEQIEDLVDISLAQCERYFAVFHMLTEQKTPANDQDIQFLLMEPQGEG